MPEKLFVKISNWIRGLVGSMSRTDQPPDSLWIAENIDLSIPGRQRLLPQDAVIVDDTCDGGARSWVETNLDWDWVSAYQSEPPTGDILKVATWKDDVQIFFTKAGVNLLSISAHGSTAVSTLMTGIDITTPVITDSKFVAAKASGGDYSVAWQQDAEAVSAAANVLKIDMTVTLGGPADRVYRRGRDNKYYKFECIRDCDGDDDGIACYPGGGNDSGKFDFIPPSDDGDQEWLRYWACQGWDNYEPDSEDYELWSATASYSAYDKVAMEFSTDSVSTDLNISSDSNPVSESLVAPAAVTANDYVCTSTGGETANQGLSVFFRYPKIDEESIFGHGWDHPRITANQSLEAFPEGGNVIPQINVFRITYPVPNRDNTEVFLSGAGASSYVSKSDFRPTRAQAYTGFRDAPVWKIPQGVAYYCIAEYTSGAFSAPEKIAEMSIPSPEETDCGIGFQVFIDPGEQSGTIRRWHIFRGPVEPTATDVPVVWLFAIDPLNDSWIAGLDDATVSPTYMKSPVPIAAMDDTETYTGFPTFKTGDAGRIARNTYFDMAIYEVLEQYAAASGVDLQPVLKGAQGIFSYVDIGMAGGGDSIETLTGLSLKEIFGAEAKDPDSMVMIASAGGRAFYTDATDTGKIWYSEIGRWGAVSNLNVLNFEDAGAPTAIKSTSGLLAIFFQDRMAVIDTRSGLDTGWSLAGEYSGVGCYHENLVTEFRGAFFWVGSGAVWQWQPGGAPQKISMQIEYPGMANDFATVFAGGNGWIAADPRLSDIVFMLPAETDISGNYSYLALESYAGEDSATYGTSRKVLVYKPEQKIWLSETLRRHYNRNTSAYAPQANRPPIVLDGRLLIPVHAVCKYFLVRQAYGEMEEVLAGCPRWKMPILETGFLSMGNFSVAKKLKRLHVAFAGTHGSGVDDVPVLGDVVYRGTNPYYISACQVAHTSDGNNGPNESESDTTEWKYIRTVSGSAPTNVDAWSSGSVSYSDGRAHWKIGIKTFDDNEDGSGIPAPYTSMGICNASNYDWFYDYNTLDSEKFDEMIYEHVLGGTRGRYIVVRLEGGERLEQTAGHTNESPSVELADMGLSYRLKNQK